MCASAHQSLSHRWVPGIRTDEQPQHAQWCGQRIDLIQLTRRQVEAGCLLEFDEVDLGNESRYMTIWREEKGQIEDVLRIAEAYFWQGN